MKFEWRHGLLWIDIEIQYERQQYLIPDCILDTGSATTAIDIDVIEFNYNKPSEIKRLFGIGGGTQEVITQQVDCIKVGQHQLKHIEIEFGDLKAELGINGFIGTDILQQFNVILDFQNLEIIFNAFE